MKRVVRAGDKRLFPHYNVEEKPIKKPKKRATSPKRRESDVKNAVAFVKKCFTLGVVCHKTQMQKVLETIQRERFTKSTRTSSGYLGKEMTIVGKNKETGAPWECASGDSLDFGSSGFGEFGISGVHDFIGVSVFVLLLWGVHVCCYHYSMVFVRVVLLWSVCCSYCSSLVCVLLFFLLFFGVCVVVVVDVFLAFVVVVVLLLRILCCDFQREESVPG